MPVRFATRCLLAAAVLGCGPQAQSQVLSEWLAPADGDWDDSTQWSTPAFPNNSGGTTYDVLIAAGGTSNYNISLDALSVAVDFLILNDSSGVLVIRNTDFTAGTIDVMNGVLDTYDSTIHSNLLTSSNGGAPIIWRTGSEPTRLDIPRFAHSVSFKRGGHIHLLGDLQLDDGVVVNTLGKIVLYNGASITTPGAARIEIAGNLGLLRGSNDSPTALGIGEGITVDLINGHQKVFGWIDHYGVIRADGFYSPGGENRGEIRGLSVAKPFTNYGVIEAVNGARMTIGNHDVGSMGFVNAGTLRSANGSSFFITGDILFDTGGQLDGDGEFHIYAGRVDLNGQTIDLGQDGTLFMSRGSLANGTVIGTQGLVMDATESSVWTFESMTLGADLLMNAKLYEIQGGLTLLDGAEIRNRSTGSAAVFLDFSEAQTVNGEGRILFEASQIASQLTMTQDAGSVIFESGITIEATDGDGRIGSNGKQWISRGDIKVGADREIGLIGQWSNEGTITIGSNATLRMDGEFSTANLGPLVNQGGEILIAGELNNTSQVLDLPGAVMLLDDAIVRGGTIQSSGTSSVALQTYGTITLDRVTLNVSTDSFGQIAIVESLTVNEELGLGGTNQIFSTDDSGDNIAHLLGNGTIRTIDEGVANGYTDISPLNNSDSTLIIGPDITILHDEPTVELYIGRFGDVVNQGTLNLRSGYTEFRNNWSNQGSILIGGTAEALILGEYTTADLQAVSYSSGSVLIGGMLDNTDAVLRKDTNTSWMQVDSTNGLSIIGGRIETGDGLDLRYIVGLDAVTLAGDLWLDDSTVDITNGLVFDGGTLHILDAANQLASGELTGTGTIRFDYGRYSAPILGFDHSITLAAGLTVETGSVGGTIGRTGVAWISDGMLRSLSPGLDLRVEGDLTHNGSAHAANGGTLTFESLTNHGSLLAESGGVIRIEDGWTNPDGTIRAESGGVIVLESWSATPGAFSLDDGLLRVEFDTDLTQLATFPQAVGSTIEIASELDLNGGTLDVDALASMVRLNGGTLRNGAVVGSSPLLLLNTTPADINTLDGIELSTDLTLADAGITQLRNGTTFQGSTIAGDGTLRIEEAQTVIFDMTSIQSDTIIEAGAIMDIVTSLVLDGTVASGDGSGNRPQIRFNGDQQVTGAGTIQSASALGLNLRFTGDLTLGPDIHLQAFQGVLSFNGAGQTLTLDGELGVGVVRTATINADTLINNGTLALNAGGRINANVETFVNTARWISTVAPFTQAISISSTRPARSSSLVARLTSTATARYASRAMSKTLWSTAADSLYAGTSHWKTLHRQR